MRAQVITVEAAIARIATWSWGIVTHAELQAAGVTRRQVAERVRKGLLIALYRGVYRVGHTAPSTKATYMAAVKACGDGAVLSGLAAAYMYGLIKGKPPPPEVTAPTCKRVPGIATKRAHVPEDEQRTWRRIPITTVARTLVDIAGVLTAEQLARACHEAGVHFKTTPRQVDAVLARRPRVKGARKLRRVLSGDERVTLSRLEALFLKRLREAGLPLPQTNKCVDEHRVDCHWPEYRLTVELDSYKYHQSQYSWEGSYQRERAARRRKERFRRYTWRDVADDPEPMLAELLDLLAAEPQ